MYITLKSIKRRVGFKGIEAIDLIVGLPLFFLILLMFSFASFRIIAIILFVTSVFLFIPIKFSNKNRMYKLLSLIMSFLRRKKEYIYFKEGGK